MHTVGKKAEMIDVHQNLRVVSRLFCAEGHVIDNCCKLLELGQGAQGLLTFLQPSFIFFFLILHKVDLFCFNKELAALKW